MRELLALVSRYVRTAVRGRGAKYVALGGVLAATIVLLIAGSGGTARSTALLGSFLVLGVLAFGVAAWSGGLLPGDRSEGREAWIATTAPAGWTRRLAAAASGTVLALAVALLGALLLGLLLPVVVGGLEVRASQTLAVVGPKRLGPTRPSEGDREEEGRADAPALRIALPSSQGEPRTLELDLRTLYTHRDAVAWAVEADWTLLAGDLPVPGAGGEETVGEGVTRIAHGAPLRLDLPEEAEAVLLRNPNEHVALVLREASLLGGRRSFLTTLLLAGLVLGVAAGAMAPIAVAFSRWTSAPTATMAGFVLTLAGGFRFILDDLALPGRGWFHETGLDVVKAATFIAPDLEVLGALALPGAGRAIAPADLGGLVPLLLYACVGLLLVVLPLPVEVARRKSS